MKTGTGEKHSANQQPDRADIARFRKNRDEALEKMSAKILELCSNAGLVKSGVAAIDDTKLKTNVALASNKTFDGIEAEGASHLFTRLAPVK